MHPPWIPRNFAKPNWIPCEAPRGFMIPQHKPHVETLQRSHKAPGASQIFCGGSIKPPLYSFQMSPLCRASWCTPSNCGKEDQNVHVCRCVQSPSVCKKPLYIGASWSPWWLSTYTCTFQYYCYWHLVALELSLAATRKKAISIWI